MWSFAAGFVFGVACTVTVALVLAAVMGRDMDRYDSYGGTD